MSSDQADMKLDLIAQSLVAGSNGAYDASFVKDLVARIAAEFDDVPVRDYVEVLVAKEAADELRRLHARQLVTF